MASTLPRPSRENVRLRGPIAKTSGAPGSSGDTVIEIGLTARAFVDDAAVQDAGRATGRKCFDEQCEQENEQLFHRR